MGIQARWQFSEVIPDDKAGAALIRLELEEDSELTCPECGVVCPGYDHRRPQWRHVDFGVYMAKVESDVPKVACPERGIRTMSVPRVERKTRYTVAFEVSVIDWLRDSIEAAVSREMRLSWSAIDRIMQRAVKRGLERRKEQIVIPGRRGREILSQTTQLRHHRIGFPIGSGPVCG